MYIGGSCDLVAHNEELLFLDGAVLVDIHFGDELSQLCLADLFPYFLQCLAQIFLTTNSCDTNSIIH